MYHNRVKRQPVERTLYLITNRITGGSMIFGDQEKERLRRLMFEGEKRCGYEIWDYVIMGNHYHALIYIPKADAMSRAEVLRRWQEAELAVNRPVRDDPTAETLDAHRERIHDISFIVGNFQQRFTQWYNKRNDRWGKLFGGRFDSVLLDEQGAVARVMAYITLNAVRARLVDDPAEYRWSGYAERMGKGMLRDNDRDLAVYLQRELGMSDGMLQGSDKVVMKRVWKRFRKGLLGFHVERGKFDSETVADLLNASNRPLELDWPERLRLKTRFVTKGVAIGSQTFVEEALKEFSETLGYRRKHRAQDARAWDEVYCLKKHRKWIG
jgi:REP element-mobilizing transposase RayT